NHLPAVHFARDNDVLTPDVVAVFLLLLLAHVVTYMELVEPAILRDVHTRPDERAVILEIPAVSVDLPGGVPRQVLCGHVRNSCRLDLALDLADLLINLLGDLPDDRRHDIPWLLAFSL